MNTYQLDPVHYFTAPGLSFDSLLKYTKIKLDYIKDVDIQLFIEEKAFVVEYQPSSIDMQRLIIKIQLIMTNLKTFHISVIWMLIIYMVGQ